MKAIIYNSRINRWCVFSKPITILQAKSLSEVKDVINRAEQAAKAQGLYAAGFVCYEAAPAFDPDLQVKPEIANLPFAFFGIFDEPDLLRELPEGHNFPDNDIDWICQEDERRYGDSIDFIRKKLKDGEVYQVNHTFRLNGRFSGDSEHLFYQLMANQPTCYGCYIEIDNWAVCSASPELFFSRDGKVVACKPMKGTVPRGLDNASDIRLGNELKTSVKCQAENVMIVDMVRNDLGHFAIPGSVATSDLFAVTRYPTLWQMTSTVQCQTDSSIGDIFTGLFPCASITGAPKHAAMKIIAELETSPRGVYCGAAGLIEPDGNCSFNVAIRTVLIDKRQAVASYGSGGGIVWDSSIASEYEEARLKTAFLTQNNNRNFQLLETMLFEPGEGIFLWEKHLRRIADSAGYFGFYFDLNRVVVSLNNAVTGLNEPTRLRLLCDRKGKITVEKYSFSQVETDTLAQVVLAKEPIDSNNVFLYHKTTNRQVYDYARSQIHSKADDIILFNQKGEITESTIANIVIEIKGQRFTPPITSGLLPGTYRNFMLDSGMVTEKVITISELYEADSILLVNSVRQRKARLIES
ncbi:MAG: chorismate-binding protein [Sedimentisphaerales bacterium]|nr:chorismate-binding protein [Sedimentisphaerales bacterium]MBN2843129.1 chorismate-binding protein [Sedimentisphaerales bacterium]